MEDDEGKRDGERIRDEEGVVRDGILARVDVGGAVVG